MLETLNSNPLAGVIVVVILLLVKEIVKVWRGKVDESQSERESLSLAKQTSETVNNCARSSRNLIEKLEESLRKNDLGHLSAQLEHALQMLGKMDASSSLHSVSLARITSLCDSVADDIRRGDHRVVHSKIISQIEELQRVVNDTKQITIAVAEKVASKK